MKFLAPLAEKGKINLEASIRDSQSIIIHAPIDIVWALLTDIERWPEWNKDIKDVQAGPIIAGATFKWEIGGNAFTSTIRMVKKPELISWTTRILGLKAIHVWRLEATDNDRTIVTTDESMEGFRTLFLYSHQKLHYTLLNWLESMRKQAED